MTVHSYTTSAPFYDIIYRHKNYALEGRSLLQFIEQHSLIQPPQTLLDVACGTGGHLVYLVRHFDCVGIDLAPGLLEIARRRLPSLSFYEADMCDFDLGHTFDVVTCLFSAISYVRTLERMQQAVRNMARHVNPGGLLMVEPWLHPDTFEDGKLNADLIDMPELKFSRITTSRREDTLSIMETHHTVATPQGVDYFVEAHEMGLFTHEQYLEALTLAGLTPVYNEKGLIGRGLYIGIKPR